MQYFLFTDSALRLNTSFPEVFFASGSIIFKSAMHYVPSLNIHRKDSVKQKRHCTR